MTDREQHLVQRQQVLLSQQLKEQHAQMEQARPIVSLLVTGVAHKVPEACCCTLVGNGVVPDNGGCFRCCSSTHAGRQPRALVASACG